MLHSEMLHSEMRHSDMLHSVAVRHVTIGIVLIDEQRGEQHRERHAPYRLTKRGSVLDLDITGVSATDDDDTSPSGACDASTLTPCDDDTSPLA